MKSSTSALLTLAMAIVTLQLASVAVAARSLSSDVDGTFSYHHVYVANGLSKGVLATHCQSKDDDLGIHNLPVGSKFKFQFKLEIEIGETLFWCTIGTDDNRRASFEAFNGDHYKQYEFHTNTNWIAKDDGVYVNLADKGTDLRVYDWKTGSPDMINVTRSKWIPTTFESE